MKLFLTLLKHSRKPAVYIEVYQRRLSGRSSTSLLALAARDELIVGSSQELVRTLGAQVDVRPSFITEEEEAALLRELEPGLKKKRYEFDHWDDVSQLMIQEEDKCLLKNLASILTSIWSQGIC